MDANTDYMPVDCLNIPKLLFQDKSYENLSVDAKVLYSLLLDRKIMAGVNGWVDEYGSTYVIYPKSEMIHDMNATRYRVDLAFMELENCNHLVTVTQPNPGKPRQIYVKDITGIEKEIMEEKQMSMLKNENVLKEMKEFFENFPLLSGLHKVAVIVDEEKLETLVGCLEKEKVDYMLAAEVNGKIGMPENKEISAKNDKQSKGKACFKESENPSKRKGRKEAKMRRRGYINDKNEIDDDAILKDAYAFGEEIGEYIQVFISENAEEVAEFFEFLDRLYKKKKYGQIKAVMQAVSLLFGGNMELVKSMKCCTGIPERVFIVGALCGAVETIGDVFDEEDQD